MSDDLKDLRGFVATSSGGLHYEVQVWENTAGYWMTVTLSQNLHYWTSPPARLHAADMDRAMDEARQQAVKLHQALEGKLAAS